MFALLPKPSPRTRPARSAEPAPEATSRSPSRASVAWAPRGGERRNAGSLWSSMVLSSPRRDVPQAMIAAREREADRESASVERRSSAAAGGQGFRQEQGVSAADYDPRLGRGEPLTAAERGVLEPQFDRDLSEVRIHRDERADQAAAIYGAQAFTLGNRIAFRHGLYDSRSASGRRLLAHELTHAVQQSGGGRTRHGGIGAAPMAPARQAREETWADVHQRVRKGMIGLVTQHPAEGEDRLDGLAQLFGTVPREHIARLYHRLEPGDAKDDFAQYFKNWFPRTRADGLGYLRVHMPAPEQAKVGAKSASAVTAGDIGKEIAAASKSLPSDQSGKPFMHFAEAMSGNGYMMNPRYWEVEYKLEKDGHYLSFIATPAAPSAWQQTKKILDKDNTWHGSKLDISIGIGRFGAAAAIKDLFNPGSATKYAVDCLSAAQLMQLRGFYLSYPAEHRDADFDRDYGDFVIDRFDRSRGKKDKSSLDSDLAVTVLDQPIKLKDYSKVGLRVGDEVPISNPYMSSAVWQTENSIYLGGGEFFGHPFGVVSVRGYAEKLAGKLDPAVPFADRVQFVLEHSTIQSYSRPRGRGPRG